MIAVRELWRWMRDGTIETTYPGERCDWTRGGVYEALGWAVPA